MVVGACHSKLWGVLGIKRKIVLGLGCRHESCYPCATRLSSPLHQYRAFHNLSLQNLVLSCVYSHFFLLVSQPIFAVACCGVNWPAKDRKFINNGWFSKSLSVFPTHTAVHSSQYRLGSIRDHLPLSRWYFLKHTRCVAVSIPQLVHNKLLFFMMSPLNA